MATAPLGSIYVRVKRANQTVFVYTEPSDTVAHVRAKIGAILKKDPSTFRLLTKDSKPLTEDGQQLAQCGVENGSILYMVFKTGDSTWEDLKIASSEGTTE